MTIKVTRCVEVRRRVLGGCEVVPINTNKCSHCEKAGGCQGAWLNRLLPFGRGVVLPVDARLGQRLLLRIDENALARAMWASYGLLVGGLFGGAALGALVAQDAVLVWRDLTALGGAVVGVVLALRLSRRLRIAGVEITHAT